MEIQDVIKENKMLNNKVFSMRGDIKEIARLILGLVKALGLNVEDLKDPKKAKKKVLNSVAGIMSDAMIDPEGIEQRFSFLAQFEPIIAKHADILKEIENE